MRWCEKHTLVPTLPCVEESTSTPARMAALMLSGVRLGLAATMSAATPPPTAAASLLLFVGAATSIHDLSARTERKHLSRRGPQMRVKQPATNQHC